MGRCLSDLKDQSGQRLFSMTNTKAHEEVSCSVDTDVSENHTATADAVLSGVVDETNHDNSSENSVVNSADVSEDLEATQPVSEFEGFGFSEPLLNTLAAKGYKHPSPIQKAAFPELMLGRDLVGQAQTGTGKTAAFALPLLERLQDQGKRPQVLVLAPTRELAMQVADSFRAYAAGHPHLKVLAVYGGADFRSQINTLKRGVEVVVGTPGRVMDHMRQGTLDTSGLRCLVLDEADEMLRMGFIDDVEWILEQLPEERQMVLFSATMPAAITQLSKKILRDPIRVEVTPQATTVERIEQCVLMVEKGDKPNLLAHLLKAPDIDRALIFTRTKHGANRVVQKLSRGGIVAAAIHGNKSQGARQRALKSFRDGKIQFLVATDIAARGIDVDGISHVFNFDLPNIPESYVHRIGRTARAGRSGVAISFCAADERGYLRDIERLIREKVEVLTGHPYESHEAERKPEPQGRGGGGRGRGRGGGGGGGRAGGGRGRSSAGGGRSGGGRGRSGGGRGGSGGGRGGGRR